MKINYKIVTIILTGIPLITYAWHWEEIFFHSVNDRVNTKMVMDHSSMEMNNMSDMTMNDMLKMMENKTGKDLEKEFLLAMIPHHEGAVAMAKKILQDKTVTSEIKNFAENIIKAQASEIKIMNEWLKKY